jgi:hypothetical protein
MLLNYCVYCHTQLTNALHTWTKSWLNTDHLLIVMVKSLGLCCVFVCGFTLFHQSNQFEHGVVRRYGVQTATPAAGAAGTGTGDCMRCSAYGSHQQGGESGVLGME